MGIVRSIIGRVSVVVVKYNNMQTCDLSLYECRYGSGESVVVGEPMAIDSVSAGRDALAKYALVVAVCGFGVITKDANTTLEIIEKVEADPATFVFNRSADGHFSFVRREQVSGLLAEFDESKISVAYVGCTQSGEDMSATAAKFTDIFAHERLTIKNILHPDSSSVTMAVVNRLKLPVLFIVLGALIANFLIKEYLHNEYQEQYAQLEILRKQVGKKSDQSLQHDELAGEYSRLVPHRYALLCDRVATLLPLGVTLTSLGIQPQLRPIEDSKKPILTPNQIVIRGEATNSDEISRYAIILQKERFVEGLKLSSIVLDQESGLFVFQINIWIW